MGNRPNLNHHCEPRQIQVGRDTFYEQLMSEKFPDEVKKAI